MNTQSMLAQSAPSNSAGDWLQVALAILCMVATVALLGVFIHRVVKQQKFGWPAFATISFALLFAMIPVAQKLDFSLSPDGGFKVTLEKLQRQVAAAEKTANEASVQAAALTNVVKTNARRLDDTLKVTRSLQRATEHLADTVTEVSKSPAGRHPPPKFQEFIGKVRTNVRDADKQLKLIERPQ